MIYKTLGSIQKFSLHLPERGVTVYFSVGVEIFLVDIESDSTWDFHNLQNPSITAMMFNPLKTKRRPLYLKPQSVPRCKHFSSRL